MALTRQFFSSRQAAGELILPATTVQVPSAFVEVTSLTFTPDANRAYAIFWYVEAGQTTGGPSSTDYHHFQLLIGAATPLDLVHTRQRATAAPYDALMHTGVWVMEANESPAPTTILLRGGMGATSSRPQMARNGRLVILRLEENDQWSQSRDRIETTGLYNPCLVVTPHSGNYFCFGSAAYDGASAAAGATTYLSNSGNTTQQFSPNVLQPPFRASDTGFFNNAMCIGRSPAARNVVYFNIQNNGAVTYQGSRNHCLVALYEPDLPGIQFTEDLSVYQVTPPTSYAPMYSASNPSAAGARLSFAAFCACAGSAAATDIQSHLLVGGTETNAAPLRNFQASNTRGWYATPMHFETDVPAGREYALEWYRLAGTGTPINTNHRQIVNIDLAEPAVAPPSPTRRPLRTINFL